MVPQQYEMEYNELLNVVHVVNSQSYHFLCFDETFEEFYLLAIFIHCIWTWFAEKEIIKSTCNNGHIGDSSKFFSLC